MFDNDLIKHRLEFARAIDNLQYEKTPKGLFFPRQRALVTGGYTTWVNDRDMQYDPNVVPAEGLLQILKSGLGGVPWYIAPFLNNVTPLSTLTAATFDSVLNEFTAYDEASRQAWTVPADPVAGVYSNSASLAVFTADATVGVGAGIDVYGMGLLSVSTKESALGVCACASKFSGARNLKTADKLSAQYDVSATSTS